MTLKTVEAMTCDLGHEHYITQHVCDNCGEAYGQPLGPGQEPTEPFISVHMSSTISTYGDVTKLPGLGLKPEGMFFGYLCIKCYDAVWAILTATRLAAKEKRGEIDEHEGLP